MSFNINQPGWENLALEENKRLRAEIPRLRKIITSERAINAELLAALRATRNELFWCAEQLKARGLPGVPGDTVDRALTSSAAIIVRAKREAT